MVIAHMKGNNPIDIKKDGRDITLNLQCFDSDFLEDNIMALINEGSSYYPY
jgi:hypothetical protein